MFCNNNLSFFWQRAAWLAVSTYFFIFIFLVPILNFYVFTISLFISIISIFVIAVPFTITIPVSFLNNNSRIIKRPFNIPIFIKLDEAAKELLSLSFRMVK